MSNQSYALDSIAMKGECMSFRRDVPVSLAFAVACAAGLPAWAHHSAAMFDSNREIIVEGVVTEYQWKNPHSYLTVKTSAGSTTLELGPPSTLGPLGLKSDTIKVGDQVKVRGNPPRRGTLALARELIRPDGSLVALNISGTRAAQRTPPTAQADSVAGTWVPEGFQSFLQNRSSLPLTERGKQVLQASSTETSMQNECVPVGAPMVMLYPTANRIEIAKDLVRLHIDWMDTERVVYMDGRKPPANAKPTMNGFSTGKWEGKTLVVDTTLFAEHREGNGVGLSSGVRKHLVERFVLSEDRKHLTYEFTLEDPDWLTAPVKQAIQWDHRPDLAPSNTKCDPQAASRYMKGD
jgi:Family of unknown function (DUF6152)